MSIEKLQPDGVLISANGDNVVVDGVAMTEVQVDGTPYWQRSATPPADWPTPQVYDGKTYTDAEGKTYPDIATAEVRMTFKSDGTVVVATGFEAPKTIADLATFIPSDTDPSEVEIKVTQDSGVAALQNDMSSFVTLAVDRLLIYRISQSSEGSVTQTGEFTIEARKIADTLDNSVSTTTLQVTATVFDNPS